MSLGLSPVFGFSLPFISYTGSQLIIQMATMGLVLSVYRRKDMVVVPELINGSGVELNPGSFSREGSKNGEKWIDNCRVDFPAINEPAGNMALELLLPEDHRIRVNFEIK